MVGRHVEGPEVFLDLHAVGVGRHQQRADAACRAVVTAGACKDDTVRGDVHAGGPHLLAVDAPAGTPVAGFRHGSCLHVRGVGAVLRLGQPEGQVHALVEHALNEFVALRGRAEVANGQHEGVVGDDRMLVLQVVVQPQPACREMLADNGHPEIAAVLAAELARQRKAQVPGLVSPSSRLAQQRFPFGARQAAVVEIGARPFAPVVEEALVVVLRLQRHDLAFDEGVELAEVSHQFGRKVEVHGTGVPFNAMSESIK